MTTYDVDAVARKLADRIFSNLPDNFSFLIDAALREARETAAEIADAEAACTAVDRRRVALAAHSIKGSAANVGFPRVALMASRAELTAQSGTGDMKAAIALLRSAVDEVHPRAPVNTPGQ